MSAVLCLSGKSGYDWTRLRGLDYATLSKLTFYRAIGHAIVQEIGRERGAGDGAGGA